MLLVAAVAAAGGVGGGSSNRNARGFCAMIDHQHAAFDSVKLADAPKALPEFDRTAARAPAAIAHDLGVVSAFLTRLHDDPSSLAGHPEIVKRYAGATNRVDSYLHDTCGVTIPRRGSL